MSKFIISYEMHASLAHNVSGFSKINGYTYQEHIIIMFPELAEDVKKAIIATSSHVNALNVLTVNGIKYTHDYIDD